jgi:K+-transporting ATPase c subunit
MHWGALDDPPRAVPPGSTRRDLHPALIACRMLLLLSCLTGLIYPLIVTGLAVVVRHHRASGSLRWRGHQAVGSTLLAQRFSEPRVNVLHLNLKLEGLY